MARAARTMAAVTGSVHLALDNDVVAVMAGDKECPECCSEEEDDVPE